MGEPGERDHIRLVSVIQYILCFVFLILRSEPRDYLKHVMKSTNMSCLTPEGAMSGDCNCLSANMYALAFCTTRRTPTHSLSVVSTIPITHISSFLCTSVVGYSK